MNDYYDLLFGSEEGMLERAAFILKHVTIRDSLIEFGCGTGDLLNYLSASFTQVEGVDLSSDMLDMLMEKYPSLANHITCSSIEHFKPHTHYDVAIAVGDTLNYCLSESELFASLGAMSDCADILIFDYHHPFRLEEFKEPYFEEGDIEGFQYGYEISSEADRITHIVNHLNGKFDVVHQRVFQPEIITNYLKSLGFSIDIYTDFKESGILDEGEKLWFVCKKGAKV